MLMNIIPLVLKVLDFIPMKGYRNIIFGSLFVLDLVLGKTGVISEDTASTIAITLAPLITYFAAKHDSAPSS